MLFCTHLYPLEEGEMEEEEEEEDLYIYLQRQLSVGLLRRVMVTMKRTSDGWPVQ